MMPYAEDVSILRWLSEWWSQLKRIQNNLTQRRPRRDDFQQTSGYYQETALIHSQHNAAYWQKMAADYWNKLADPQISGRLRDYYENEARLCDAETKKVEEQGTDR